MLVVASTALVLTLGACAGSGGGRESAGAARSDSSAQSDAVDDSEEGAGNPASTQRQEPLESPLAGLSGPSTDLPDPGASSPSSTAETVPTTVVEPAPTQPPTTATPPPQTDPPTTTELPTPAAASDPLLQSVLDGAVVRVDDRISFSSGASSATVENAVIRGERDVYTLEAGAGQTMSVRVGSFENNAVVTVVSPDGQVLASDIEETTVALPVDGDYRVVVGGTRGNATYALEVGIT